MRHPAIPTQSNGWTAPGLTIDAMPFVGVLLALVVTVAATMPQTASSRLDLPPPVVCDCGPMDWPTISLSRSGVRIDDRPSSLVTLKPDMCRAMGHEDGRCDIRRVSLRADADTPYGRVAETVGRLERAGIGVSLIHEDMGAPWGAP